MTIFLRISPQRTNLRKVGCAAVEDSKMRRGARTGPQCNCAKGQAATPRGSCPPNPLHPAWTPRGPHQKCFLRMGLSRLSNSDTPPWVTPGVQTRAPWGKRRVGRGEE